MKTIEQKRLFQSPYNGLIECIYAKGRWSVFVEGYDQSSVYITNLWREALRHLPRSFRATRILMLGLGAGAAIKPLHQRFSSCTIEVIEWDSVMCELANTLTLFTSSLQPTVLLGDVADLLPTLTERYDLIICDLFHGPTIPTVVESAWFNAQLARLLSPDGFFILNAFARQRLIEHFDPLFDKHFSWKYKFNLLAAFQSHKGSRIST